MDRWRTWNAQKLPGRAVNRFVRGWVGRGRRLAAIEVHRTACIVTHPPGGEHASAALVNPANERLVGTQFTPEECWRILHGDPTTGRWDKDFVTYPHQAIDGLVTEFGGDGLRLALAALPADAHGRRCAVTHAVVTPTFDELRELYESIIHTAPPMHRTLPAEEWAASLTQTYHTVFDTAQRHGLTTLALPLLGAGANGAPKPDAMRVAAEAAVSWAAQAESGWSVEAPPPVARFGVQTSSEAHALVAEVDAAIEAAAGEDAEGGFAEATDVVPPGLSDRWALPNARREGTA